MSGFENSTHYQPGRNLPWQIRINSIGGSSSRGDDCNDKNTDRISMLLAGENRLLIFGSRPQSPISHVEIFHGKLDSFRLASYIDFGRVVENRYIKEFVN